MRTATKLLLGGATALVVAGSAALAAPAVHHMTVDVPGGSTAEITYTGDFAPKIVVNPAPLSFDAAFGPAFYAPFAQMDRIAAQMDRLMRAADRQMAASLARFGRQGGNGVTLTALPPGTQGYSFISTFSGNDVCTRMVRITSAGNGAKPEVVSQTTGNCGAPAAGGDVQSTGVRGSDSHNEVLHISAPAPHPARNASSGI